MAVDPRKRQKKLERQRAKQKAQRREVARHESLGLAYRLEQASHCPILHCLVDGQLWNVGIGEVVVSRLLRDGQVAYSAFLIDAYCLGVKDAMARISSRARYDDNRHNMGRGREFLQVPPEHARKLVEDAVLYARKLGFEPHPDYHKAMPIFGNISAAACCDTFEFGHEGKPLFAAGPYDDQARCRFILNTLEKSCGPNGYNYLIPEDMAPEGLAEKAPTYIRMVA